MYAAHVLRNGLGTQGGLWGQGWWLLGLYSTGRRKIDEQRKRSTRANVGVRGGTELGGAGRSLIMGREKSGQEKIAGNIRKNKLRAGQEACRATEDIRTSRARVQTSGEKLGSGGAAPGSLLLKMHVYTLPFLFMPWIINTGAGKVHWTHDDPKAGFPGSSSPYQHASQLKWSDRYACSLTQSRLRTSGRQSSWE